MNHCLPPAQGGTRARENESWVSGVFPVPCLSYLATMLCVLWHIAKVFSRVFRGDCLFWDVCCGGTADDRRQKSLTRYWLSSVQVRGFVKWCR